MGEWIIENDVYLFINCRACERGFVYHDTEIYVIQ